MLSIVRILVMAQALAALVAMLPGCGHKGPLSLPNTPESQGRATLPQVLNPWHTPTPVAPKGVASEPAR
jgi:predicted small lipoprotein YifL